VDLALKILADGIHLGKNDMPIDKAKILCGDSMIVGATANSPDDIFEIYVHQPDYFGLGPLRFTETKKNLNPILGLEGYKKILETIREKKITIPIFAVGGVKYNDIDSLLEIGVYGFAISSAITQNTNPVTEAKKWVKKLN
jgi:thiamine-phosphate pyrophosphorylase